MMGWLYWKSISLVLNNGTGFKYWKKDLIWGIDYIKVIENPWV